ncbi:hypothetical protein [Sutterella wadsworthensis]
MKKFIILFKDLKGKEFKYTMVGKDLFEIDVRAKALASKVGWTYITIL